MAKQGRLAFCQQLLSSLERLLAAIPPALQENANEQALHDFRIALRSLLSALLPWRAKLSHQPRIQPAISLLRHWLHNSNALRDYDVQRALLLQWPAAQADQALTCWMQEGLSLRKAQLQLLQQEIASRPWSELLRQLKQELQHFFLQPSCAIGRQLRRQRYQLLKRIHRCRRKLQHAPAQHPGWHDLRIDCKKLRYLLESHGSRCSHHWRRDARWSKAWQDQLGQLHDLAELQQQLAAAKLLTPALASLMHDQTALRFQQVLALPNRLHGKHPAP